MRPGAGSRPGRPGIEPAGDGEGPGRGGAAAQHLEAGGAGPGLAGGVSEYPGGKWEAAF